MQQRPSKTESLQPVPVIKPFGRHRAPSQEGMILALLGLSHTVVEHRIYLAMWSETNAQGTSQGSFGIRKLMRLTCLSSYSSIRRGCLGLISKLSVATVNHSELGQRSIYQVYSPDEIFARRRAAIIDPYPKEIEGYELSNILGLVIEEVLRRRDLSRREALVALWCADGLSNTEIGLKLGISEKTVKFHLRSIFIKLGVKRRAELVGRLLPDDHRKEKRVNQFLS